MSNNTESQIEDRFDRQLQKIAKKYSKLNNQKLIDDLENFGMLDQISHELKRFKSVNYLAINVNALWKRWIRS